MTEINFLIVFHRAAESESESPESDVFGAEESESESNFLKIEESESNF